MAAYGIVIRDLGTTAFLQALQESVDRETFIEPIGEAGTRVLKDHFRKKNLDAGSHKSAQRLGAQPSGLFEQFHNATSHQRQGSSSVLSVNHPAVRQRFEGGDIRPVNSGFLTIPAQAAAYGTRAREAGITLAFMYAPDEQGRWRRALVAPSAVTRETGKARKDGTRRRVVIKPSGIWYWLVRKVHQLADPSVLPTRTEILDGIKTGLESWANRILKRG